ncbi:hypothetical protein [Leisingera methylohalidivorans]|uniref:Uncharacterized protein n=1 Tax=Leisingera methylohalidivorans DSM 14336 TaxID=999552 RepID=V9VZ43_9RHOB|nr:hypothetical protein [Leisingera methylohalidivorans]AHD03044.1 hypothetical protein METH_09520 [Leisingera methylohalidivorans DSM 14336]
MAEPKPDIVEMLRRRSLLTNVAGGSPLDDPHLTSEAADEIERLRAALAVVRKELELLTGENPELRENARTVVEAAIKGK